MKRLSIVVDEASLMTILQVLTGTFTQLTIEDIPEVEPAKPSRKHRASPKFSRCEAIIKQLAESSSDEQLTNRQMADALAAAGFSPASYSPVVSRLVAKGFAQRTKGGLVWLGEASSDAL